MEIEGYREVLADLAGFFGEKAWLSLADIARYDGCDTRTARKRYDIPGNGINRALLARKICMKGRAK